MQVTFMVKLMVSLVNELESKGFEIDNTSVTEDQIEVLTFQNDNSEYTVSISTGIHKQEECLKLTGKVKKEYRLYAERFKIEPLMRELKCGERMTIERTEDGDLLVKLTKCLESKFSMEGVDKDATRDIALDIIGVVTNS